MVTDVEEKWICPNCGEKMQKIKDMTVPMYVCPACGCSVEASNQNYAIAEKICPNCSSVLGDDNECPRCGYDLGSDFD